MAVFEACTWATLCRYGRMVTIDIKILKKIPKHAVECKDYLADLLALGTFPTAPTSWRAAAAWYGQARITWAKAQDVCSNLWMCLQPFNTIVHSNCFTDAQPLPSNCLYCAPLSSLKCKISSGVTIVPSIPSTHMLL